MQVVDGLQRLSTVHSYAKDGFALDELEYLQTHLSGKRFSQTRDTVWGRRLYTTQINVNVIDPQTPAKVKFDIFKRINTLGEPLTAQEIRHCMSQSVSRQFLKQCANSSTFLRATAGSLADHKRMADREAVLRFCAFRMLGDLDAYDQFDSMDVFLTEATDRLDSGMNDGERTQLAAELARAMTNAFNLFGEHAFRKWPEGAASNRVNPINKPLLESWAVGLSAWEWNQIEPRRDSIVSAARKAMKEDYDFIDSITSSTGDPRKVRLRFYFVRALIERAGTGLEIPQSSAAAQWFRNA